MMRLTVQGLGTLRITMSGDVEPVFESARLRALLLYLAVEADHDHFHRTLARLFWPHYAEDDAVIKVRRALSSLARALGDRDSSIIDFRRDSVRLSADGDIFVDVHAFTADATSQSVDRVERAIGLYRGPFGHGIMIRNADDFNAWLAIKRAHLEQILLTALQRLTEHHVVSGSCQRALEWACRQIELVPQQSVGYQQLMWALASAQDRSPDQGYRICSRLMAGQVGLTSAANTRAVLELIQRTAGPDVAASVSSLDLEDVITWTRERDPHCGALCAAFQQIVALLQPSLATREGVLSHEAVQVIFGHMLDHLSTIARPALSPQTHAAAAPIDALTAREREILVLICAGQSNADIAAALVVSVNTIKKHAQHIFAKLRVHTRAQAIVRAYQLGLNRFPFANTPSG